MLKVSGLEKSFRNGILRKKKVLKGISFELNPEKITGFLGPNGAGKTTTLKIIMGLLKADRGVVEIKGEPLGNKPTTKIGYLPETPSFYPYLKVKEFLYIIGKIQKVPEKSIYEKIDELSLKLSFGEFLGSPIKALSKGTLQKVAFSQALMGEPELIILDEPFSGLDPIVMNEIRGYILDLKEQKRTILISSHMLLELERVCHDVILINQGEIILKGDLDKLKKKWKWLEALEKEERKDFLAKRELIFERINSDEDEISELLENMEIKSQLYKIEEPTLEDIFIKALKYHNFKQ